ncbi:MAG: sensor histidine kinase [Nocardioides sp.]
MTRRPGSLTARLVLAMTLVAAVATGATGLLAAPLLRGSVEDAARAPLGRQADLLARLPNVDLLVQRAERRAAVQDLDLGVVTSTGQRDGAARALSSAQVDRLLDGQEVSGTGRLDGDRVVIEARPTARGGGVVLAASANSVDESARALLRRLLLALLLGLALALAAAAAVGSRLARPLARTASAARQLASGDRGVGLPAPGTREVGDVIDALGSLDRALTTSESRQREFLLSVSHELRTPLTALRGLAEGLADGTIPPEEARSVGRTMAAESQRLARYVDDLLALARMEADDFTVRTEEVDLAVLVREAAEAWQERARRSGMTVRSEGGEQPVLLTSDGARLRQVVDALADNAVRVCPPGSVLVLGLRVADGSAVLEVRDSGPGLTEDDLEHAFEPGVLHDRYAGTRSGGQGLGLALVQRMVTRLGGTVRAGTAAEGGVAFTVVLPR